MKISFKYAILYFLVFLVGIGRTYAQQFQWVHGGGSVYDFSSSGSTHWEQVKFMCTDPNGNVYVLSQVGNDPIVADTFHVTPYGGTNNTLLTSYNCSGQMRWAKLIASSGGDCTSFGIASDSLGHIYVAGSFDEGGGILHIGYDTAISGVAVNQLATSIIQLDTAGHFKWIRYVGVNTFTSLIATGSLADPVTIDGANNAHYFCYIQASGIPLMAGVNSVYGVYDMTYNTSGTLLSAVRLDLDSQWYLRGAVIDPTTNKLYVYGEINTSFGTDTFFAAAFDASRNLLWQYFAGHGDDDAFSGIALDQSKHLYFSGGAQPFTATPTVVFNNDSVSAPGFFEMSFIMKTDTNGTVGWIKHYDNHIAIDGFNAITLLPNSKIAVVGTFAGTITDGINFLTTPPSEGQNPFLVVVDSAGDLQTIQQIHGDGFYDWGLAMASDKVGNIYFGGLVTDSIWAGPLITSPYISIGGNSDFFIMKYGVPCSCTSMPIASYTDTGTHTIGFTYTGTSTTSIDSVVWSFGDGGTSTATNPIYTYTANGTYNACVTVYSSCGNDSVCSNVIVSLCPLPVAAFSDTGVHTLGFTYSGTSTGIDSVVWNFGDGSATTTTTNPLHTYTATGTYTVCVTAYSGCGSNTACHIVTVSTVSVPGLHGMNVQVFPNPASDELYVTGVAQNISYRLLNVTGASMQQGILAAGRNTLSMKGFASGIYILEMTGTNGERNMVRVVKE